MEKLFIGAAFTLLFVNVSSFGSENNPRNCNSQEVIGYSNQSDLVSLTTQSGILHIQGEPARTLYIQLSSKEEPGNPKEVTAKNGLDYTCFKQSANSGNCAIYQCQFAVGDSSTGKIGF